MLPDGAGVSLRLTMSMYRRAEAMLIAAAAFLAGSRWRLLAWRRVVTCSRLLSWILGDCKGRASENNVIAALTTSVAGGAASYALSREKEE